MKVNSSMLKIVLFLLPLRNLLSLLPFPVKLYSSDIRVYHVWISRLQRGVEKKAVGKGETQGERTKTGWKGGRREKDVSDGVRGGYPPGGATIVWMEEMSLEACWANHEKTGEACIVPLAPIKLKTGAYGDTRGQTRPLTTSMLILI